jgi:hypothetical protein
MRAQYSQSEGGASVNQQPAGRGSDGYRSSEVVDGRRPRLVDKAYRVIRDDLIALRIEPGAASMRRSWARP